MKTCFVANTGEEAQTVFGQDFYRQSQPKTQPELDERVQLGAFLRTFALSAVCQFPIIATILPREKRPDFKVTFGSTEVGIETSKIANSELEQMRTVQRQKKLGTIEISSLLRPQAKRSLTQKIEDCTGIPVFIFPVQNQALHEDAFWIEKAQEIITRKDSIAKEPTFSRYGASWLLLWDKMSGDEELEPRIQALATWLAPFWKVDFFEKIIIQQQHSEQFFILSRQVIEIIEKPTVIPDTEFSLPEDIASSIEGQ